MGYLISGFFCRSVSDVSLLNAVPTAYGFRVRRSTSANLDAIDLLASKYERDSFIEYQRTHFGEGTLDAEIRQYIEIAQKIEVETSPSTDSTIVGSWFLSKLFASSVVGYHCDDDLADLACCFNDGKLVQLCNRFSDSSVEVDIDENKATVRIVRINDNVGDQGSLDLASQQAKIAERLKGLNGIDLIYETEAPQELHSAAVRVLTAQNMFSTAPMGIGTWDFDTEDKSFEPIAERLIALPATSPDAKLLPFAYPVTFNPQGWFSFGQLPLTGEGRVIFPDDDWHNEPVLRILTPQQDESVKEYLTRFGKAVQHRERGVEQHVMAHELKIQYKDNHSLKPGALHGVLRVEGGNKVSVTAKGLLRNRLIDFIIAGRTAFLQRRVIK